MQEIAKTVLAGIVIGATALSGVAHSQSQQPLVKNIVLVHGAFADGTSWAKVIPILEARGFHVAAVQNPLTSLSDDVNEPNDLGVIPNLGDHSASPRMTNKDDRTILHRDNPTGRIHVVRQGCQRVLNGYNMKAACFKDWNDFGPARTIRKRSVNEHDILHGPRLRLCGRDAGECGGDSDTSREYRFSDLLHRILLTELVSTD